MGFARTRRARHTSGMNNFTWGHAARGAWRLDPDFLTVNHGSFGATPEIVLAAQLEWRRRMEAQPTRFMAATLPDALAAAKARLAGFLRVRASDLAFVDNATSGCNAVLRSLKLEPGDEVLALDHVYGAVRKTIRFVTGQAGARMVEASLGFPDPEGAVAAVAAAITPRTRIAVIDHITSTSALIVPLARIIAACHTAGVPVLVDGAHAPGQIDLDIEAVGADWYTGNCHKWLSAPKGCAFLWTAPSWQGMTHPTVISHGYGQGYEAEFDWTGTRDPSAVLTIGDAIDFHERLGGPALRRRNVMLADQAAALLTKRLDSETIPSALAMRIVRLPARLGTDALAIRARLLAAGTDAPVHANGGGLWLRVSAFAYNELEDYDRLAGIVVRLSRENVG